jgi:hypothetical protein
MSASLSVGFHFVRKNSVRKLHIFIKMYYHPKFQDTLLSESIFGLISQIPTAAILYCLGYATVKYTDNVFCGDSMFVRGVAKILKCLKSYLGGVGKRTAGYMDIETP